MTADFAGFSFTERVGVDALGEEWAAATPDGRKARARRVAPALASHKTFVSMLVASGERLAAVRHPNVVTTLAVGREPDGTLVVVGEDVAEARSLDGVLREARLTGKTMGTALALHVVRQVARGLARAHKAGVVHGGVHPRSVLVDGAGEVRLADFAVARALAAAAAEDDSLLRGLLGYVAPELALGDAPDARTDVFSLGALLTELVTGSPPPGLIEGPPQLAACVERALHTDAGARYPDAADMLVALEAAAVQAGGVAGGKELVAFVREAHGGADQELAAQTEDLLADLVGDLGDFGGKTRDQTPLPPPVPLGGERPSDRFAARGATIDTGALPAIPPTSLAPEAAPDLDDALASLEDPEEARAALRSRLPLPSGPDSKVAALPGPQRPDTEVDPALVTETERVRLVTADVVSEAVDDTAALPPPAQGPGTTPGKTPAPTPGPRAASVPALSEVRPRAPAAPAPPASFATPPAAVPPMPDLSLAPRGGSRTLWLVAVVAVAAVGVVIWKSGILTPGERAAEERAAIERVEAEKRAAETGRPRYADVVIDAEEDEAAVWMRLGRTPLDSLPLSTASIYELRVEMEGMKSVDHVITPGRWTGSGDAMSAAARIVLEPAPVGWVASAAPAEEPPKEATARAGKGRIHVESEPSGAEVWLLVGFTPAVRVTNLPTDRAHDFKVMLDGFVPGLARVEVSDFVDPTGAPRAEVSRQVTLRARPKDPAKVP